MCASFNHKLTKQQQEIVDFTGNEVLIRGIAGSGKTLVLLKKAKETAEKYPKDKIAIFTYSSTLTNAAKLLMREFNLTNIDIRTFHSWAMSSYYKVMNKSYKMLDTRYKDSFKNALQKVSATSKHRLVNSKEYSEFLKDEISWMKGKGIDSLEEYLEANRRGRGSEVRVTKDDRKIIFKVYQAYQNDKGNFLDFDDFGLIFSKNLSEISNDVKFDHIFIDEAQDLQQAQLLVLRAAARKSFIVAADKGQKIYKTSFAWRDIGLNITGGRTKILKDSFRSTKQIIQLAASLQQHDSIIKDDEYVPPVLPSREGPKPVLIHCSTKESQDKEVAKAIKQIQAETPKATIAILTRDWRSAFRIKHSLDALRLQSQFIKKEEGNPHEPGIKLSTYHSSKGLEFDYVMVMDLVDPNLADDVDEEQYWELERRLLYVSITRACTYLQLYSHGNASRLLKELDDSFYDKVSV
ncbi:superfamily I DNA/RNA helicase [Bacillus mesophilus]|uniref:DNA 3'-5' helicase n=1 Tax=Bacillus mesophilus TaxID=1808955 RepID=A0A6M0Q5R9_9BACI|nr:ATP-dependent helicase [Bacillus mesophilus]MBM7660390.1 superfamily I DNA/RNA helicase [Bacillus mesophilus]NEY71099.1 AAA family ATPase [Bacillus mesophilus]